MDVTIQDKVTIFYLLLEVDMDTQLHCGGQNASRSVT